jgi:hypothetical protein
MVVVTPSPTARSWLAIVIFLIAPMLMRMRGAAAWNLTDA